MLQKLISEGKTFNKWRYSFHDEQGYGLHGDFLNGWDQTALESAMQTCDQDSAGGVIDIECVFHAQFGYETGEFFGRTEKLHQMSSSG